MSLHMVILQNTMWYSGEGDFILFDKIPVSTIELLSGVFQLKVFVS